MAAISRQELREELGTFAEELRRNLCESVERIVAGQAQSEVSNISHVLPGLPFLGQVPHLEDFEDDDNDEHEWKSRHFRGYAIGEEMKETRSYNQSRKSIRRLSMRMSANTCNGHDETWAASTSNSYSPQNLKRQQPKGMVAASHLCAVATDDDDDISHNWLHRAPKPHHICELDGDYAPSHLVSSSALKNASCKDLLAPPPPQIHKAPRPPPGGSIASMPEVELLPGEVRSPQGSKVVKVVKAGSQRNSNLSSVRGSLRRASDVLRGSPRPFCGDEYEPQSQREALRTFVRGPHFDYLSGMIVVMNAISLGVQTDWQARHVTDETTLPFRIMESTFCAVFTCELILRVFAFQFDFLRRPHVWWNMFDCFLVGTQLTEEVMSALIKIQAPEDSGSADGESSASSQVTANFSIMRVMRILRLIRVMRLMRVLRLIGELRTMLLSILGSLKSLVWAVILLFLMMYIIGVYLTQLVLDKRVGLEGESKVTDELITSFGSLGDTILSLYQAVTGGVDWSDVLEPLRQDISGFIVPFFMLYIAFALLCMLNVITGVFVESALLTAKKDKDVYMINHIRALFQDADLDGSGAISWEEFEAKLSCSEMQEVFKEIDIDGTEAQGLFRLLDMNDSGTIDAEEFINGCTRIRGAAKSLDLQLLMRETSRLSDKFSQHVKIIEKYLKYIAALVPLTQQQNSFNNRSNIVQSAGVDAWSHSGVVNPDGFHTGVKFATEV